MERESGYYWVKYKNEWSVAEWVKCKFTQELFRISLK